MFKVGELAKRAGLTIRTLHHYDEIGLLKPSGRSDAGYRLYSSQDIERLYRILALKQLGLPLADIGPLLANHGSTPQGLIERQMQALDTQIAQAIALRERLRRLHQVLQQQGAPTIAEWLATMERITMYDKYFTEEEQATLRQRISAAERTAMEQEWPLLIAEVRDLMTRGVAPDHEDALALAMRWGRLVQRGVGSALIPKLHAASEQDPELQATTGIDHAMIGYVMRASAAYRLSIYARYLDETEMQHLRANYGRNAAEWPPLISQVREMMQTGESPLSPRAQAAAQVWLKLTSSFLSDDSTTRAKMRKAMDTEPDLLNNTGIDQAMLTFLRTAAGMETQ